MDISKNEGGQAQEHREARRVQRGVRYEGKRKAARVWCWHGKACRYGRCPFRHPTNPTVGAQERRDAVTGSTRSREPLRRVQCWHGQKCWNRLCPFVHPSGKDDSRPRGQAQRAAAERRSGECAHPEPPLRHGRATPAQPPCRGGSAPERGQSQQQAQARAQPMGRVQRAYDSSQQQRNRWGPLSQTWGVREGRDGPRSRAGQVPPENRRQPGWASECRGRDRGKVPEASRPPVSSRESLATRPR